MNHRIAVSAAGIAAIAAVTAILLVRWSAEPTRISTAAAAGEPDDEHAAQDTEFDRGPHGGRLLTDGDLGVEIVVFETGMPPEFRLYGYAAGAPIAPDTLVAEVVLERLGGETTRFPFEPEAGYLRGIGTVREPHSFDVEVGVGWQSREYRWRYESHEGRTTIPRRVADAQGIVVAAASPATIRDVVDLTGTVQIDPGRIAEVRARFPGIVTNVGATIGDTVARGDRLATIETNESLRAVAIEAPIDGLIIDRNVQSGQPTGNAPLFVIADLSQVWINLDVFGGDLEAIGVGQTAEIETLGGTLLDGTIDWVSPLVAHGSQSIRARITADNPASRLRPGQFVRARVVTTVHEVPLAVDTSALQTFRDFDVVFARVGDVYEARMLELGQRDADHVEVLDGLAPGEVYVSRNSYLIKADIEKAGASHDH